MPPNRREFWLKMPENPNSKDLLNNADTKYIIIDVTIFFFFRYLCTTMVESIEYLNNTVQHLILFLCNKRRNLIFWCD